MSQVQVLSREPNTVPRRNEKDQKPAFRKACGFFVVRNSSAKFAKNRGHWYHEWYQRTPTPIFIGASRCISVMVDAGTKSVIIKEDNEMAKDLLSDSKIKAAKPKEKDYTLSDGEV
ncbi:hypothetical protein [Aeromonas veronii]|uniref:hypothetical protein n=1 Tax=Aeromonas veronii TaxID=654 RepID=UPI0035BB7E3E